MSLITILDSPSCPRFSAYFIRKALSPPSLSLSPVILSGSGPFYLRYSFPIFSFSWGILVVNHKSSRFFCFLFAHSFCDSSDLNNYFLLVYFHMVFEILPRFDHLDSIMDENVSKSGFSIEF